MIRSSRIRILALGMLLAACSNPAPPASNDPSTSVEASSSVPASVIIGDPGSPISLRPPGRPFDTDDILGAMRDSRRPGGVAEELQTDAVAAAVADTIWTLQGDRWDTIAISGACDAAPCSLEVAGSAAGDAGDDVWVLSVDPATAEVTVVEADLHGVPPEIAAAVDTMARSAESGEALDGLLLTSVRWHAPPDEGTFALAYRSGDEEESCSMDVELDIETVTVTEVDSSGC